MTRQGGMDFYFIFYMNTPSASTNKFKMYMVFFFHRIGILQFPTRKLQGRQGLPTAYEAYSKKNEQKPNVSYTGQIMNCWNLHFFVVFAIFFKVLMVWIFSQLWWISICNKLGWYSTMCPFTFPIQPVLLFSCFHVEVLNPLKFFFCCSSVKLEL